MALFQDDLFFQPTFPHRFNNAFRYNPALTDEPDRWNSRRINSSNVEVISDNSEAFEVELSVEGFRPEDLKVDLKTEERVLTVTAKHEEKSERGTMAKQFSRSFNLPESCKLGEVQSILKRNGVLRIVAPKEKQNAVSGGLISQDDKRSTQIFNNFNAGLDRVFEDERSFNVEVNVDGFEPGDLSVDVDAQGLLTVSAKHEERARGNFVSRHFRRQYHVPDCCSMEDIKSVLSKEGVLRIQAQKKQNEVKEDVKKVTIEVKK